jgi:hypothetical protein
MDFGVAAFVLAFEVRKTFDRWPDLAYSISFERLRLL